MRDPWKWTEEDIRSLIHNKIGESTTLEYKACDSLGRTDGKKKEISKDVSAFANSAGGTIIYGVTENSSHEPEAIDVGFDPTDISGEWLEQVINSNIERRIGGIIINSVLLPKTQPGKVLYVVSIPESKLAPHMAADDRFYKRFNFQSVAMKEYEVRNLIRQEGYPSRDVVCAWRDYVMNPLLSTTINEQKYLEREKWTWDRWSSIPIEIKEITYIGDRSTYSGNQEQFLESYPEIQQAMDDHDKAVAEVNTRCEELFEAIKKSHHLLDIYLTTITPEALQPLKIIFPSELGHCATDEDILQRIFGSSTNREDHLATLAEYILNKSTEFSLSDRTTAPIWNTHRDKFLQVLEFGPIANYWNKANQARERLLKRLEHLVGLLRNTRSELTRQHGVPVEVHEKPIMMYRSDLY
jgi:hypothetical protein